MLLRYVVRGYITSGNYHEYIDIERFATFDEALECWEIQQDDDRVTAMFDEIVIREVF